MKFLKWNTIRLILMFALVVFLYSFTSNRNAHRKLKKTEIIFVGDNHNFIKQESVNKLLIENNSDVKTIEKSDLNLNKLENSLNKHPMIEKSEVYVSVDGVLKAVVKQKTPIARVFNNEGTFYIDYEGNKMQLSNISTARVPLISGIIDTNNNKKLSEVLKIIYNDNFLKKNIIGIKILTDQSLMLTNRNYDFSIEFGKMRDVETKFKNYKAFFQKAVSDTMLDKYKKINLRFTQQVVCTK